MRPKLQIALVLGTRPEIIKMSPLPAALRAAGLACRVIHTGQHYDDAMTRNLFTELGMPAPDVDLEVGSAPHGQQTGRMLCLLERELLAVRPDWVLVQGDTNSTLAGALAAAKLGIPVAHLEAGLRCGDRTMPEEINRILVDQLAELLFAPTPHQVRTLLRSGIPEHRIFVTGNTIADVVLALAAAGMERQESFGLHSSRYVFMTLHRQENVDSRERLSGILQGAARVAHRHDLPVVLPMHPRTARRIEAGAIALPAGVRALPPLGYRDCLGLQAKARLIMTDSGGVQEEACLLGVPCVTLRERTERVETLELGANRLAGAAATSILEKVSAALAHPGPWHSPYGNGDAAAAVAEALCQVG